MKMFTRPLIGVVVSLVLIGQDSTEVMAGPTDQIAMIKPDGHSVKSDEFREIPESEWGWWIKPDWKKSMNNGLSKTRLQMLKVAANYGNAQAQYVLGMIYSNDDMSEKAMFWLAKAARQGHSGAQFTYNYYLNDADVLYLGC